MDLYSIEHPEIVLNSGRQFLRQSPESNTIFYHVFEVEQLLIPFLCNIGLLTVEEQECRIF